MRVSVAYAMLAFGIAAYAHTSEHKSDEADTSDHKQDEADTSDHKPDEPVIYLCGDSTMAKRGNGRVRSEGWGVYFDHHVRGAKVVNRGVAGTSVRSAWNAGEFANVTRLLKPGDVVLLEYGHNDAGDPRKNDTTGKAPCPSNSTVTTCRSEKDGSTVFTFGHYVKEAAKMFIGKGATVVVASQTPNNPWETGQFVYAPPRFVQYAKIAAQELKDDRCSFVDHFNAAALMYMKLGNDSVNGLFPDNHIHTNEKGAKMVAKALAQAIATCENGTTSILPFIKPGYDIVY